MKRMLFLLIAAMMVLAACGKDEKEPEKQSVESEEDLGGQEVDSTDNESDEELELLYEKDLELQLVEDENIVIELLKVGLATDDIDDYVAMQVDIENKQNKTYEFYMDELTVDGKEIESSQVWIGIGEIKPNETINTFIHGFDEDLTIEEHVSGSLVFKDAEGSRNVVEFSEYINE